METDGQTGTPAVGRFAAKGAIVLAFIVALEIVIMISPFALFFYAIFNPFLLALAKFSLTRWLTAFFLPHMIVPPDAFLGTVRVLGSVFFIVGLLGFSICAVQVYAGKLLKTGVAEKGLYAAVRHPQYLSLAVAGVGLAILWPRFLTLVLLAIMLFLYYLLAKDEERRMLSRYGDAYHAYLLRTGMFFPRLVEAAGSAERGEPPSVGTVKAFGLFVLLLVSLIGSGFALRAYTVGHLPLRSIQGVDAIAITAEDLTAAEDLLSSVLQDPNVAGKLAAAEAGHRLLAYVIPIDYTMQGMIADTGEEWRLFEQHKTIGMITEYLVHPFGHLTDGHAHGAPDHAAMMAHGRAAWERRIIFIDVSSADQPLVSPRDDFGIDATRRPRFFVDVHLHTGDVLQVKDIPTGSGWGTVPTPTF